MPLTKWNEIFYFVLIAHPYLKKKDLAVHPVSIFTQWLKLSKTLIVNKIENKNVKYFPTYRQLIFFLHFSSKLFNKGV